MADTLNLTKPRRILPLEDGEVLDLSSLTVEERSSLIRELFARMSPARRAQLEQRRVGSWAALFAEDPILEAHGCA